jgi:hypothetical protein
MTGQPNHPTRSRIGVAALCLVVGLGAAAAAAAGVFLRGDGSSRIVTSVRGETYAVATTGIYLGNAQRIVAEGVGWDLVTLALAVPALLITLPSLAKGSLRARLFVMGLLAYFFYQYLMYALTWAFGPMFLVFVGIYAASLVALVWVAGSLPWTSLESRFVPGFPRRSMAVLCIGMSTLLLAMWLHRILIGLRGDAAGAMLLGQTTLVVQALDLGLVVPLAIFTGVMAWRRRTVGYLLSSVFVVKMVTMTTAICAMLLSAWAVEGALDGVPFAIFAAAAVASAMLGVKMYRCIDPSPGPA